MDYKHIFHESNFSKRGEAGRGQLAGLNSEAAPRRSYSSASEPRSSVPRILEVEGTSLLVVQWMKFLIGNNCLLQGGSKRRILAIIPLLPDQSCLDCFSCCHLSCTVSRQFSQQYTNTTMHAYSSKKSLSYPSLTKFLGAYISLYLSLLLGRIEKDPLKPTSLRLLVVGCCCYTPNHKNILK